MSHFRCLTWTELPSTKLWNKEESLSPKLEFMPNSMPDALFWQLPILSMDGKRMILDFIWLMIIDMIHSSLQWRTSTCKTPCCLVLIWSSFCWMRFVLVYFDHVYVFCSAWCWSRQNRGWPRLEASPLPYPWRGWWSCSAYGSWCRNHEYFRPGRSSKDVWYVWEKLWLDHQHVRVLYFCISMFLKFQWKDSVYRICQEVYPTC